MRETYLSYQDVFLIPEYSDFTSRDEVGTMVEFGDRSFRLPVVPANMACVINEDISKWMSENGYFYIMHRFNKNQDDEPNTDNWKFLKRANEENWRTISVSIGVQEYDKEFILNAISNDFRIDFLTIDIAHAHSSRMKGMIEFVKSLGVPFIHRNWKKPFIIAGNVATPEAVMDLERWGADSVKVGIAQGGACTTYGMTGFGEPMFSCMLKCSLVAKTPLIADGGIKTNGDIAKAIRAGGTMVMAGSIFAACIDAPGKTITKTFNTGELKRKIAFRNIPLIGEYEPVVAAKVFKEYYGSASEHNKHTKRHVEGTRLELPCNGLTYEQKLSEITDSYSSSISYSGGGLPYCKWGIKKS